MLATVYWLLCKHLSGVENALGVEGAFDASHGLDCFSAEGHREVGGFDVADAVLAADRASEFDRHGEGLADGLARAADGFRVRAVAHEVDVYVAVAEVPEVDDERPVASAYLLDALDEFRHARARHDHVLVELERPELLYRGRQRAPNVPKLLLFLARLRAQHVIAAQVFHDILDDARRALDLLARAIHGD